MPDLSSTILLLLMFWCKYDSELGYIFLCNNCVILGAASSLKLGRLSIGSAKAALSGLDDLLSSTDGGKHDYDW